MTYTPLEKLSRNFVENVVVKCTYVTDARANEQTYERKGENYIPLGINARDKKKHIMLGQIYYLHIECAGFMFCQSISVDENHNETIFEPPRDKTNKMACAPSEDSDQPGHPPSLIRVFAVRMKKAWVLSYLLSAQRRL